MLDYLCMYNNYYAVLFYMYCYNYSFVDLFHNIYMLSIDLRIYVVNTGALCILHYFWELYVT